MSYPEMGCASNGLQSALMREQTHAEKTGMCTRPSPQEALSLLDRRHQAIQAAQHDSLLGVSYRSEVAAALQSVRMGWELDSGRALL